MRPSNAVRTVWDAEAIDTSHLGFRPIQKIATIHASSGFIRGIPTKGPLIAIRNPRPPDCLHAAVRQESIPTVTMGKYAVFAGRGSASLTRSTALPFRPILA